MKNNEWEPVKTSEADEVSDEISILSIKSKTPALSSEEAASTFSSSNICFSTKDKNSLANSFSSLSARVTSKVSEKVQSCTSEEDSKDQPHVKKLSISEQLQRFGFKPQVDIPQKPNSPFIGVDVTKLNKQTQIMFDDSLFRTHRN